jgi:hypothetical protein
VDGPWRSRARAALATALACATVAAVAVAAPAAGAATCTRPTPSVTGRAAALDALRSEQWTAADLTGSVDLTDGRKLWLYGDTITSGLNASGGAVSPAFTARNSAIVQQRGCFTPLINGSGATARSWIPELGSEWNWPMDGYARGGTIWVYASRLAQVGSGVFGFQARAVDLVEVDQATMSIRRVHRGRYGASPILWGSAVTTDGTWTYLYGRDELGTKRRTYLARVAAAGPLGSTAYWTGAGWSSSVGAAAPIFTTEVVGGLIVADLGPAFAGKRYVAALKDGEFLAGHVEVYHAAGPAGPWFKAMSVAAPGLASDGSTWTYLAAVHGIDPYTGGLHITWNVNSFDTASVTRNVHAYTEVHRSLPLNLRTPAGAPAVPTARAVGPASGLATLAPARLVDSRTGIGGLRRLRGGTVVAIGVAGRAGVPAAARGVVATFTVVGPAGSGHLTVWPCGAPRPITSSLNYLSFEVVANTLLPALGSGGAVCVWSLRDTHLLVDVAGWTGPGGAGFAGVAPTRLVDTRQTGRLPAGSRLTTRVAGRAGVPAGAKAVVVNLTATGAVADGYVTAWPCSTPRPTTSVLNVVAGRDRANNAVVPLAATGDLCLFVSAPMHVIIDVNGWYGPGGGPAQPVVPIRRLDTRNGQGGYGRPGPGQSITLPMAGAFGIPAGARAVRVNVTAVGPSASTFVTAYPCSRWPPGISTLNTERASPARANGATVPLGPGGRLCLITSASTHLIVDVEGYVL